eukprot:3043859-Pleurochrysis_carterae.AAC.2
MSCGSRYKAWSSHPWQSAPRKTYRRSDASDRVVGAFLHVLAPLVESDARAYSTRRPAATVTGLRRWPRPCGRPYRERVGASE